MNGMQEPHVTIARYVLLVVLAPLFLHPRHSTSRLSGWLWNKPETAALLIGWALYGYLAYAVWMSDAVALVLVP